eukprot:CFRG0460T1
MDSLGSTSNLESGASSWSELVNNQYECRLPAVAQLGASLRLGFEQLYNKDLVIHVVEAVLVGETDTHAVSSDVNQSEINSLRSCDLLTGVRAPPEFDVSSKSSQTIKDWLNTEPKLPDSDHHSEAEKRRQTLGGSLKRAQMRTTTGRASLPSAQCCKLNRDPLSPKSKSRYDMPTETSHDVVNLNNEEVGDGKNFDTNTSDSVNKCAGRSFQVVAFLTGAAKQWNAKTNIKEAVTLSTEEYLQKSGSDALVDDSSMSLVKRASINSAILTSRLLSKRVALRSSQSMRGIARDIGTKSTLDISVAKVAQRIDSYTEKNIQQSSMSRDHETGNVSSSSGEKMGERPDAAYTKRDEGTHVDFLSSREREVGESLAPSTSRVLNIVWDESLAAETIFDEQGEYHGSKQRKSMASEGRSVDTMFSLNLRRGSLSTTTGSLSAKPSSIPESETLHCTGVDHIDRMLGDAVKLVLVVMEGSSIIGEVAIPIRNLVEQESWFAITPLSPAHMDSLSKVLRKSRGITGYFTSRIEENFMHKQSMNRKLCSVRTSLLVVIFFELLLVLVITTVVVYHEIINELNLAAQILVGELWESLEREIWSHFLLPQIQVTGNMGFFLLPTITTTDSASTILGFLNRSYNDSLYMVFTAPERLYAGTPESNYYGAAFVDNEVGKQYHTGGITMEVKDPIVNNVSMVNPVSSYMLYGVDYNCADSETGDCIIYNTSEVRDAIDTFNVTGRPWYIQGKNNLGVQWSGVYTYVGGDLGITVAYRIPQALSEPLKFVLATDITLRRISVMLQSMNYYDTGYSVFFEINNSYLLGTSIVDVNLTSFVNCSSGTEQVHDRKRLDTSGDSRLQYLSDFLYQICELEGKCYIEATPELPVTAECQNPSLDDLNCTHVQTSQTAGCKILPPAYVNISVTTSMPNPASYVMPNGDLLTIGYINSAGEKKIIAVVIPQEDYAGYYDEILNVTVGAAVLILFFSLLVALILAHIVSRKLEECTKNLARFANLDFSSHVNSHGLNSPIREIARIYEVMSRMRLSLRSFSKYVPPDVVRLLVQSGREATLGGQNKIITCFCTDIVDFTTVCEHLDIGQLNSLLGDYLQCMSEIIHERKGTVDKYIGDSIVAMWNAPEIVVDHAHRACEAALLCQARLAVLRDEWEGQGLPTFYQRIGIHTGPAIVGNVGCVKRLNYTAIGNNVDFASRLEAYNKKYGTDVLISDSTYAMVRDSFVARPVDDVVLPGLHPRTCRLYELVAHVDTVTEGQIVRCERFEKAYTTFHDRRDAHATLRFLKEYRNNHLYRDGEGDIFDPNYEKLLKSCKKELGLNVGHTTSRRSRSIFRT